jgi:hypothetical protein
VYKMSRVGENEQDSLVPSFRREFSNVLQTASPRLDCPSRCIVRRCWNTSHSSSGRGWVDSQGKLLLPSQLISLIALYSGAPRNILGQWFHRSLRAWTKIPPGVTGPILQERQSEVIACYGIGTELYATRSSSFNNGRKLRSPINWPTIS